MKNKSIALLLYGSEASPKDAFTDEKYKDLAAALIDAGFKVTSVLYNDGKAKELEESLLEFGAVLVWVNPIEQGTGRHYLDLMLRSIADKGVYVSSHPDIILKMGTKEVLYTTRDMDWGADTEIYHRYEDFKNNFLTSLSKYGIRVIKQYRGNSGNGVFKIYFTDSSEERIKVIHAPQPNEEKIFTRDEFHNEFLKFFKDGGLLVNQEWIKGISNGMVRCYLTGSKVSGFGYQESNALCPQTNEKDSKARAVSKRFYFTEDCGLFQDLRKIMESKWIPELKKSHSISDELMPLIWDIDLFINDVNTIETEKKFSLCEINVSCVSPFPPSCIKYIVEGLEKICL